MSSKIAAKFADKPFSGGLTYQSHPMCLAVACETLKVLREEDVVGNAARMGVEMTKRLAKLKADHPSVGDVRSIGLFGCLELVKNRKTKEPMAPFGGVSEAMTKVGAYIKENGLYHFQMNNIVFCNPPLTITTDELSEGFHVYDKALAIADQYVDK